MIIRYSTTYPPCLPHAPYLVSLRMRAEEIMKLESITMRYPNMTTEVLRKYNKSPHITFQSCSQPVMSLGVPFSFLLPASPTHFLPPFHLASSSHPRIPSVSDIIVFHHQTLEPDIAVRRLPPSRRMSWSRTGPSCRAHAGQSGLPSAKTGIDITKASHTTVA